MMESSLRRLLIAIFIVATVAAALAAGPGDLAQARAHHPGPSPSPSESPTPTPEQRIADLQQKLKDNPNDFISRAQLGELLVQVGKPLDARDQLEQALKGGVDDARVWYFIGQSDSMLQDPVDATLAFEKAELRDPANPGVLAALVDAYLSMNRIDDAKRIANRSVQLNPKDSSSYESLGMVQLNEGKFDDGRATLQKALAIDPSDSRAKMLIARSYLAGPKADPNTALAQFTTLLAADPNNADLLRGKADALAALNRVPEAVAALQQVVKLEPDRVEAEDAIAELYLSKKMIPEARQAFTQAQKDHPTSEVPWVLEAEYDAQQKNWQQSSIEYQTALQLSKDNPQLLSEYGRVQLTGLNQPAAAAQTFAKLVALHPTDAEAVFFLGQAYALANRWADARDQFKKAFQLSHSYEALFNLGLAFFNLNDLREARGVFEALAFSPAAKGHPNPQLWFVLGDTDRKMGDKRSAVYSYKQFLALVRKGPAADRARSYIKQLGG